MLIFSIPGSVPLVPLVLYDVYAIWGVLEHYPRLGIRALSILLRMPLPLAWVLDGCLLFRRAMALETCRKEYSAPPTVRVEEHPFRINQLNIEVVIGDIHVATTYAR